MTIASRPSTQDLPYSLQKIQIKNKEHVTHCLQSYYIVYPEREMISQLMEQGRGIFPRAG